MAETPLPLKDKLEINVPHPPLQRLMRFPATVFAAASLRPAP